MANRFWVGGTASWNGTATGKWSTTSGGAAGAAEPTTSDDVFFDVASGAVTVTVATTIANCRNLDFTGFTGTFAGTTQQINVVGNLVLVAAMTFTFNQTMNFGSGTITTAGKTLPAMVSLGTLTLLDDLTSSGVLNIDNGTFDANDKNLTLLGVSITNSTVKIINMGSGTWTLTGATDGWSITGTNVTINASTSTIKYTSTSNSAVSFAGDGKTYYNLWFAKGTSTATLTITGANTFNDLRDTGTGNHTIVFPNSTTTVTTFTFLGTVGKTITFTRTGGSGNWTLSASTGIITINHISISNGIASGGATFNIQDGTDGGGNTGWNFISGPRYWVGGSDNWDGTIGTKWAISSGGTGGESVPTTSNNVYLDANSGASTVTINASSQSKNLTLTGFTGTLAGTSALAIAGNLVLNTGFTLTYSGTMTFSATSSITSGGATISFPIIYNGSGQTFTLADALVSTSTITLTQGTLNFSNFNVTCVSFASSNSNTRVLTLGSGTLNLTGTGNVFDLTTVTNLIVSATTGTIKLTNSSISSKTFIGGGKTFGNFWNATGNTGVVIITGSNTFTDFKITGDARTTQFTAGTTTTFSTLTVTGLGQIITSVTGATHTLSVASGVIQVQNTTISYSIATGGATFLARTTYSNVDGGNNSGWIFAINSSNTFFAPLLMI